jgi:hypothetical protein
MSAKCGEYRPVWPEARDVDDNQPGIVLCAAEMTPRTFYGCYNGTEVTTTLSHCQMLRA